MMKMLKVGFILVMLSLPSFTFARGLLGDDTLQAVRCDLSVNKGLKPFEYCLRNVDEDTRKTRPGQPSDSVTFDHFRHLVYRTRRSDSAAKKNFVDLITADGTHLSAKVVILRPFVPQHQQAEFDELVRQIQSSNDSKSIAAALQALGLLDSGLGKGHYIVLSAPKEKIDKFIVSMSQTLPPIQLPSMPGPDRSTGAR